MRGGVATAFNKFGVASTMKSLPCRSIRSLLPVCLVVESDHPLRCMPSGWDPATHLATTKTIPAWRDVLSTASISLSVRVTIHPFDEKDSDQLPLFTSVRASQGFGPRYGRVALAEHDNPDAASAPFILRYEGGAARVNDIVLGTVIAIFALVRVLVPGTRTAWLSWLNAL
mgnify:CR=1 FL=1